MKQTKLGIFGRGEGLVHLNTAGFNFVPFSVNKRKIQWGLYSKYLLVF